jgi:hypothetical protein
LARKHERGVKGQDYAEGGEDEDDESGRGA